MKKEEPIIKNFPYLLHGGDYNPDQWLDTPEIIDQDMRLMPLARCNAMSVGIFSWAQLEPEEGVYDFQFLDDIFDRLHRIGVKVILATPSGARPAWMSQKHPEVLRVNADRTKNLHGFRHNHCYTSPYYRQKTRQINALLAERYKDHPALALWHVSNEFGGECHCQLCRTAFREWLKEKYHHDLKELNHAYWAAFWSHTYTDWEQIEPPSPLGETQVHGLNLDWKRFVTHQTMDFIKNETEPLKRITPHIPVTTNFMGKYEGLDYFKMKDVVDVISWDNYPRWHVQDDIAVAQEAAFHHDLNRSLKKKPFLLMESTPSLVNWWELNRPKKPGMHMLSSLQAVAHGSDSVLYFQWRKSRGSSEKLHGAVVDHCGHEHTRVFREVAEVGRRLEQLHQVVGAATQSRAALVFDWENRWAIDDLQGMGKHTKKYCETVQAHYNQFWQSGINVDIIDSGGISEEYKLIIAPMLYMIKPGVTEKMKQFVRSGGTLVLTYASGWADEHDLCFLGGFPGGALKEVFGIWAEELDALRPDEKNQIKTADGKSYDAVDYCELLHDQGAEVLGRYQKDFYAGMAALTCHDYGKGKAYYIGFRDTGSFLKDFYAELFRQCGITGEVPGPLPLGVTAHTRQDGENLYLFLENYTTEEKVVTLAQSYTEMTQNQEVRESVSLPPYGNLQLRRSMA